MHNHIIQTNSKKQTQNKTLSSTQQGKEKRLNRFYVTFRLQFSSISSPATPVYIYPVNHLQKNHMTNEETTKATNRNR